MVCQLWKWQRTKNLVLIFSLSAVEELGVPQKGVLCATVQYFQATNHREGRGRVIFGLFSFWLELDRSRRAFYKVLLFTKEAPTLCGAFPIKGASTNRTSVCFWYCFFFETRVR